MSKKIQIEMSYMPHTDALVWVAFSDFPDFPLLNTRYFHFVFKVSDFWAWLAEDVLIFLLKKEKDAAMH